MSEALRKYLRKDRDEVYGSKETGPIYPTEWAVPLVRIIVTAEQNKKRFAILMTYLGGTVEEINTEEIPDELRSKCRSLDMKQPKTMLVKAGAKSAYVQTYGEHMFRVDFFINGRHDGGSNDMTLGEFSSRFERDQATNPFRPGLI